MTLDATVQCRRGEFTVDVALSVMPGETVALLGPNGAGKSTVLRALAGLVPLVAGRVTLDGTVLEAPAEGVYAPPERRPIGLVFQDYLLFPHLDARDNVAFGLRACGVRRAAARHRADELLDRFGVSAQSALRPAQLSGGQAQRVALARALATEPRLLLLDEPLAALDAGARGEVRRDLRRSLAALDAVRILVTHDPVDAYALADRIIVLEHGRASHAGSLADVTAHPRTPYVAELVGVNLFTGTSRGDRFAIAGGPTIVTGHSEHGDGFAAIRPQAVSLHRRRPEGSPRNVWSLTLTDIDTHGERVRVRLAGPIALVAEITTAALVALGVRPGDSLWASVKATEVTTYPTE